MLLLFLSSAFEAPSKLSREGNLTGGFVIPCMAQTHVDLLFGSSRSCCGCYLLICVAAGAGLHLKMCKFRPWWLQQSDGMRFWKGAQLVSPSSRSSGAAFKLLQKILGWFGLGRTLKNIQFHPLLWQGHLSLSQVVPSPVQSALEHFQ